MARPLARDDILLDALARASVELDLDAAVVFTARRLIEILDAAATGTDPHGLPVDLHHELRGTPGHDLLLSPPHPGLCRDLASRSEDELQAALTYLLSEAFNQPRRQADVAHIFDVSLRRLRRTNRDLSQALGLAAREDG